MFKARITIPSLRAMLGCDNIEMSDEELMRAISGLEIDFTSLLLREDEPMDCEQFMTRIDAIENPAGTLHIGLATLHLHGQDELRGSRAHVDHNVILFPRDTKRHPNGVTVPSLWREGFGPVWNERVFNTAFQLGEDAAANNRILRQVLVATLVPPEDEPPK